MKLKKSILGAALAAAFGGAVQAAPINVGGVVWDPDYNNGVVVDWSSTSAEVVQRVDQTTRQVSGWGRITMLNNQASSYFCPGCELTFVYSGYTPTNPATPTPGSSFTYTGGLVQFFVDTGQNFNIANQSTAANGNLWLSAVGNGNTTVNYLGGFGVFSNILLGGLLDVTGGLAAANLNTNTRANGADLNFATSLNTSLSGETPWQWYGTGTFRGDSVAGSSVPEPGTLALAGLGLLGLGLARRRKA